MHDADVSCSKGARARHGDATGNDGKSIDAKHGIGISARLFHNLKTEATLGTAAQYAVNQGLAL